MNRLQAYRFELKLNGAQQRQCAQFAGVKRYIYNKALALQQTNYAQGNKYLSYASIAKHLSPWRNDPLAPWLKEAPFIPSNKHSKTSIVLTVISLRV
jgi:putative transposase